MNLSLEGPAWKISRLQGIIKLRHTGDFFIANEGKRPIYVDSRPVPTGNKQKLNHNAVVEVRIIALFLAVFIKSMFCIAISMVAIVQILSSINNPVILPLLHSLISWVSFNCSPVAWSPLSACYKEMISKAITTELYLHLPDMVKLSKYLPVNYYCKIQIFSIYWLQW